MKSLIREIKKVLSDWVYVIVTLLVTVASYLFEMTHYSMGIDDTAMEMYLEKGLLPETGRWVLFLINKVIHVSDFTPYVWDIVGAVLLWCAAAVFCALFRRMGEGIIPRSGYILFTCVFVSNPLFSENNIYYLHNTADLAWLLTAIALFLTRDALECFSDDKKAFAFKTIGSVLLIFTAAGCYESFVFVYVTGVIFILFLDGVLKDTGISFGRVFFSMLYTGCVSLFALILRGTLCKVIPVVFRLEDVTSSYVGYRSVGDALRNFTGPEGPWNLKDMFLEIMVKYQLNALVNLPIAVYVLGLVIFFIACVKRTVKTKSIGYILLFVGIELLPFVQSLVAGYTFPPRSGQMIVIFTAMMILYASVALGKKKPGTVLYIVTCVLITAAFVVRLNHNFKLDQMRYENDAKLMTEISTDVCKAAGVNFGDDLCVYFAGYSGVPLEFRKGFFIDESDARVKIMRLIMKPLDGGHNIVGRQITDGLYFYDHEMQYSHFMWAREAFNGTNDELVHFINLHGGSFTTIHDLDEINDAKEYAESMPAWPEEGSVVLRDGYYLVHVLLYD